MLEGGLCISGPIGAQPDMTSVRQRTSQPHRGHARSPTCTCHSYPMRRPSCPSAAGRLFTLFGESSGTSLQLRRPVTCLLVNRQQLSAPRSLRVGVLHRLEKVPSRVPCFAPAAKHCLLARHALRSKSRPSGELRARLPSAWRQSPSTPLPWRQISKPEPRSLGICRPSHHNWDRHCHQGLARPPSWSLQISLEILLASTKTSAFDCRVTTRGATNHKPLEEVDGKLRCRRQPQRLLHLRATPFTHVELSCPGQHRNQVAVHPRGGQQLATHPQESSARVTCKPAPQQHPKIRRVKQTRTPSRGSAA